MNIVYLMHKDVWKHMSEDTFMTFFPDRYKRSKKYVFENDSLRCAGVGVLLYKVLGLTEKDLYHNEFGKPFSVKGPPFSISHSGDYVALAYAATALGMDIEKIDEKHLDLVTQVLTEDEVSYVGSNPRRFYQIWTLKESLSKAVGEGLNMSMREVSVLALIKGEPVSYQGKLWYGFASTFGDEDYVLSGVKDEKIIPKITKLDNIQYKY